MNIVVQACEKMIAYSKGNLHDIDHFLKVWPLASTIGKQEMADSAAETVLELAAIVHDIACPLCRIKYGNTLGGNQEKESAPLVKEFFAGLDVPEADVERISWLVSHHHTYSPVDGLDHRILLEADYLVNAGESGYTKEALLKARERIFATKTGKRLLDSMFLLGEQQSAAE